MPSNIESDVKSIFELHIPGRRGVNLPILDGPQAPALPAKFQRKSLLFPEVSENEVDAHFTRISRLNRDPNTDNYPLGSCTVKWNPKINDAIAAIPEFAFAHPDAEPEEVRGLMEIYFGLQGMLSGITGMPYVSLDPKAGAHGELHNVLMARAFHDDRGEADIRNLMVIPDSAHGTNPASAAMAGYEVASIATDDEGNMNLKQLSDLIKEQGGRTAGIMFTQPTTFGLFDRNFEEVSHLVKNAGGIVIVDGANLNAFLGIAKISDLGDVDAVQLNLHKTFSTPHGGGGPGSAPVCYGERLAPYGPETVQYDPSSDRYYFYSPEKSIGKLGSNHGNPGMIDRAYTYILGYGELGLREIAEAAVVNANYLQALLMDRYRPAREGRTSMHEAVFAGLSDHSATTMNVCKRMLDFGAHPPTMYFPIPEVLPESMMFEPTESATKKDLDDLGRLMIEIADEALEDPEILKSAPHSTPVRRLDEVTAARKPRLTYDALQRQQ
jgi:glycine dehydrogenase subunit 2